MEIAQPVPFLDCPHRENVISYIHLAHALFQLLPSVSHPSARHHSEESGSIFITTSYVLEDSYDVLPSVFLSAFFSLEAEEVLYPIALFYRGSALAP